MMCNLRTCLLDGGLRSRYNRTGDRSDHGGMSHLSGDQIIRPYFSESQEFVDELSLTAFAMAQPSGARPPASRLVSRRGGNGEPVFPPGAAALTGSPPPAAQARGQALPQPAKLSQAKPNWETPRRSRCVNLVGPDRGLQPWACVRLAPASLRRTRAVTGERTLCASCV